MIPLHKFQQDVLEALGLKEQGRYIKSLTLKLEATELSVVTMEYTLDEGKMQSLAKIFREYQIKEKEKESTP